MTTSKPGLVAQVRAGRIPALARLLTHIENDTPVGRAAFDALYPDSGEAHLIGVTGPPGGGKSTLVNELIRAYRARGQRVAVVAVDPSSPLTGGATLGDRIRMNEWHADPDVFIRSMASRRFGGGLAENTLAVAHILDATGFDPVIVETVGTGQDEVEIARLALTTLLIQVPGLGDSIQTLKAGSLEIGDILVVNKADRPEAIGLIRDLHHMKALAESHPEGGWDPPVVKTSALKGEGIDNLIHAIAKHRAWLESSGELAERLRTIAGEEVAARVRSEWRRWAEGSEAGAELAAFIGRVADREVSPRQAASDILEQLTKPAR